MNKKIELKRRMSASYAASLKAKPIMITDHPFVVIAQMEGQGMCTQL